ncbi:MAG: tetratricopeptide repeat protein, partial [Terriglobia bacterium]
MLRSLPNDPVSHLYLGSQAYEQKQFAEAKRHFEKAGDLAMQNPEALPMVLETYLATRDRSVPERVTQQLMTANDPDPQLVFQVGLLLGRYGQSRQAVAAFERIRERYPDRQALVLNLSAAQLEQGDANRAIQNLESLVNSHSVDPEVYLLLGEAYHKAGLAEKAYASFDRAIQGAPQSEEGYLALSNFASAHHNNAFGLKTVERGLQQIPGSAKLFLQQGVLWALESNLEAAAKSFQVASQADTAWGLPLLALGIVQLQSGEPRQAASTLRQAIAKMPGDYRPPYFLGTALTRAGAQSDPVQQKEVIAAFRKAISLEPSNPQSRVALGQAYLATNQVLPAVVELEKAMQLSPRDSTVLYQ